MDATNPAEFEPILLRPWPALEIPGPVPSVDTTDFEAIDYAGLERPVRAAWTG